MKIIVPIKQVVDPTVKINIMSDQAVVDLKNSKKVINPFDEIAIEEAVKLLEKGIATEVIAVTCGSEKSEQILRTAMAMGADRSVLIETDLELPPLSIANLLKEFCLQELPDLVICGKQAVDDDSSQVGQMLAALMAWPQALCASNLVIKGDNKAYVTCEIDGGSEIVRVDFPALISVDLRLNIPRYIELMNIIKAKNKRLDKVLSTDINSNMQDNIEVVKVFKPENKRKGIIVENVDELLDKLRKA